MITDMVLLLIILSGLLVMRWRIGGAFGLTHLLWKQVMILTGCGSSNSLMFWVKGIIWLVLGFVIEIPQIVSKAVLSFLPFLFTSHLRRRCSHRCI
jgi:hypothetical protein